MDGAVSGDMLGGSFQKMRCLQRTVNNPRVLRRYISEQIEIEIEIELKMINNSSMTYKTVTIKLH